MAQEIDNIWKEDIWNDNPEELTEEDVIIQEEAPIDFPEEYEEDQNDYIYQMLSEYDDEQETEEVQRLRDDPDVNMWLPPRQPSLSNSGGNFGGIFRNEGATTGQPTSLNSSAVGRGQMIRGTRLAMYKKLGITNVEAAEQEFRTNPDFEMQVMEAYRGELDARIPSDVQGKQREYMIAKGWYTGDPFYDDNKVPGRSAGNKITAGEYARRATMAYGGELEIDNIPELEGISDEAIADYLQYEGIDANTGEGNSSPTDLSSYIKVAGAVQEGVSKFKQFSDTLNATASKNVSEAIDFSSEVASIQNNALSLRKFRDRKNQKRYSINNASLNQPLIYT